MRRRSSKRTGSSLPKTCSGISTKRKPVTSSSNSGNRTPLGPRQYGAPDSCQDRAFCLARTGRNVARRRGVILGLR